jgi:hypothetical protein
VQFSGPLTAFHGTDLSSAKRLLAGDPLDAATAALLKTDGLPGFFLASRAADAEFFAVRQTRGPAVVLQYELSVTAVTALASAGALLQPIPLGRKSPIFTGDELYVPRHAFDEFNRLLRTREIVISPAP